MIRERSPPAAEFQHPRQHAHVHVDRAVRLAGIVTEVLEIGDRRRGDRGEQHIAKVLLDDGEGCSGRCSSGSGRSLCQPGDGRWRVGLSGRREVQQGRGVGELCVVAGSASGIQVSVAGVMRCQPGDRNIRAGQSRAGVACGRSSEAKSEMSVQGAAIPQYVAP